MVQKMKLIFFNIQYKKANELAIFRVEIFVVMSTSITILAAERAFLATTAHCLQHDDMFKSKSNAQN